MSLFALLVTNLLLSGVQGDRTDLFSTPGVSNASCKWSPFDCKVATAVTYRGMPAYEIVGSDYGMSGSVEGVTLLKPPTATRLRFSAAFRSTSPKQTYGVVFVGQNPKAATAFPWTSEWEVSGSLVKDGWTKVEREICLPAETKNVKIIIHNPNKGSIFMSDLKMLVGEPAEPDAKAIARAKKDFAIIAEQRAHPAPDPNLAAIDKIASQHGPVVAHILMRAPICTKKVGETGVATFPIPTLGTGQVPLAYKFECLSPGKLIGCSWKKRADGRNEVCEVTLQPGTKGAWLQYDALVLLGGPQQRDSTPPPSAEGWSRSTACVQSSDSQIQEIAQKLSAPGDTEEAYARKVMEFVKRDMGKGAPFKALDARAALECGGSCTNKANLSAALLRAHGISARTVSHMPTWATEKFYEHWLTEFWQPGKGWVAFDATIGSWEPDRRSRVVLSTANPSDEDRAFEPLHERFVMPGAPYLSVAELSPTLYPADLTNDDEINSVNQVGRFDISVADESALFELASKSFKNLADPSAKDSARYNRILSAAKSGKSDALAAAIRS